MQQAMISVPRLFENYQTASVEKRRIYALAEIAANADLETAEAACDAAYDAAEAAAEAILRSPARSITDLAIKAQVLLGHGIGAEDLLHYRPADLVRFVQEVRGFIGR